MFIVTLIKRRERMDNNPDAIVPDNAGFSDTCEGVTNEKAQIGKQPSAIKGQCLSYARTATT